MSHSRYAQVLVDGFGRLGALTYNAASHSPSVGDAVRVPFGKRTAVGVVVALSTAAPEGMETKDILEVYGPRASESDILALQDLSEHHVSQLMWSVSRLAPTKGKSQESKDYGPVTVDIPQDCQMVYPTQPGNRTVILRSGFLPPEAVAAHEVARLHPENTDGQILVMCPTLEEVRRVLRMLPSGAAHLDPTHDPHAWRSFLEGSLKVAVTTSVGSWYAAPNLTGIIVVEEQSPAHASKASPPIHNREAAIARASASQVSLTLVSANPTPHALSMPGITVIQPIPADGRDDFGTYRFLEIDSAAGPPEELYLAMEGREEEFAVIYRGASEVCARCYTPSKGGICNLCGFDRFTELGLSPARVRKVYGAAKPVKADKAKYSRGLGEVVLPHAERLLLTPTLQPYAPAVAALTDAATAAGPGGRVWVLTRGRAPEVLVQAAEREGLLDLARMYYRDAKRLLLPPFGRAFTITVFDDDPWDTTQFPGFVHGPRRFNGRQQVLVRCAPSDVRALRHAIDRLHRARRKVKVATPA